MEKLDLDFAALLVGLTLFTGIVWGIDRWLFSRRRRVAGIDKEPVLVEYCRSFFPVILAVLVIRSFIAEPFRIPSSSMMPTLLIGDFILVNKFAYGLRVPVVNEKIVSIGAPERGDIIVFRYPGMSPDDPDKGTDFIKRVVGVPGDEVAYRNKVVYVNGQPVVQEDRGTYVGEHSGQDMSGSLLKVEKLPGAEHQILQRRYDGYVPMREGTWTVGQGEYFVLGDNRDNSKDSRFWGMVPEENLVGKAFLIWMNYDGKDSSIDFSRIGSTIE
jgi:signal peptidase I